MELDLTELESPEEVEFPLFHINTKYFTPTQYETENADFEIVEKYIYACFSCLPFSKLKIYNSERYLIESYCEIFVFHNKESILCSIFEKICMDRTVFFFEILNQRIKNNEFNNCEEFLYYFLQIWNNFLTVILHLSDVFKIFTYYSKTNDQIFRSPAQIFCDVWKNCFRSYSNIKDYLFLKLYNYMKQDQLYTAKNFFKCIYSNIKDNFRKDSLLISVEGFNENSSSYYLDKYSDEEEDYDEDEEDEEEEEEDYDENEDEEEEEEEEEEENYDEEEEEEEEEEDNNTNNSSNTSVDGGVKSKNENTEYYLPKIETEYKKKEFQSGSAKESIAESANESIEESVNGSIEEERTNGKRARLNSYGVENNGIKAEENEFFHLLSKEIKDDLQKYKSVEKSTIRTGEDCADLLRDTTKLEMNKSNSANNNNNNGVVKIDDVLLSKCLKILDKCNLYDAYAELYVLLTVEYYTEKIKERVKERLPLNNNNDENKNNQNRIQDVFNLPFEIETYLCNEQMRCHKFMKMQTEKTLLKKLKEVLILKYIHILYNEETIKQCIIYEQLESLRILYLFSINMCCVGEFCNLFFHCAKELGTIIIQRLMENRENIDSVNEEMTELANFKLNIDRIIIISFKHSSRFIKKWKETFEQLLSTGKNTDRYMSYIVSLYLNNLLMMHNACMKKMKKINLVYKEFMNRAHHLDGAPVFDILENDLSRSIGFYNVDDTKSDISVDSDGIYIIKRNFQKFKELSFKHRRSDHMTMNEIHTFFNKIKQVFVKYTDIGKNILNKITIMLSVFKFLDNKERFEKHFRVAMSKRLLNDEYLNIFLDVNVFKALKKECGSPYTKKIEYIIKDVQEEKELMDIFYSSFEGKQNVPYFIKKKKFSVKTVCDDAWDFLKLKEKVVYPDFIRICNESFMEFYKENKKGRSVVMQPLLGLCVLKVNLEMMSNINNVSFISNGPNHIYKSECDYMFDENFNYLHPDAAEKMGEAEWSSEPLLDISSNTPPLNDKMCYNINLKEMKSFCFIVTIVQGIVLLLFNQKYEYTTEEIESLTGLKKHTIQHFLKPLYAVDQTKILLYDEANDKLKLNYLFRPNKKYIKVGYADFICSDDVVIPPTTEPEDTVADKNLFIDAAVVHFLKINASAIEKDICDHVISRKPGTTAEEVKARIDLLVQKEFIGFKDDMYCYV